MGLQDLIPTLAAKPLGWAADMPPGGLWSVIALQDYNTRIVVLSGALLGAAAGALGTFVLLRKRALLGDAISHATLPGICGAFLVGGALGMSGKSLPLLLVGGLVSGGLGAAAILGISRWTRLKEDAALGIVLSVFFGAGTALSVLVQKLQTIVSRNVDPLEPAVVSVTKFHSGTAWNIIPNDAVIGGTVRAFSEEVQGQIEQRIRALCEGTAASHGATISVRYERRYPPTVNSAAEAELCATVAEALVGPSRVNRNNKPAMGSEDFAWMLRARPGAYIWLGNGTGSQGGCMVHNPGYDFNDAVLPIGAAYWVRLAETTLARR